MNADNSGFVIFRSTQGFLNSFLSLTVPDPINSTFPLVITSAHSTRIVVIACQGRERKVADAHSGRKTTEITLKTWNFLLFQGTCIENGCWDLEWF